MSSISSALSSLANSSSTSSTSNSSSTSSNSSTFMGTSTYSNDLQNVISRAVAIANFPIQQLTDQQTTLQNQSTELSTIDTKLATLQTAVQDIQQSITGSSFQAAVSNTSLISTTLSSGATEGNYSIEVDDIGAYATSLSASSWPGTSSSTGSYNLVINGTPNAITTTDNSASGVAAAINSQYGSQVHATVVNVGSSSTPDYRLSLQSTSLGSTTLNITDSNGTNLQTTQTAATLGRMAQYIVNGSGITVNSTSRSAVISTGITVSLLASSVGNPVNITVTRPTSALSTALSSFADAYNGVIDELNKQHGSSAGPLQGQSILYQLQNTMSQLGTYSSSSGSINGLTALGLELNKNGQFDGHLTFDQFTLIGSDLSSSSAVTAFLGSATTGGFLKSATDILTGLEQTSTGLVKSAESSLTTQITSIGKTISTKQDQVSQMQINMENRMATMDAMIATMQQQYSYFSSVFQAQQTADQLYTK
jgi:flagellar hook-associated protein 2